MGPARRVKFRFGIGGRRWGFSRPGGYFWRRTRSAAPLQQDVSGLLGVHEAGGAPGRQYSRAVLATSGSLELRLAESEAEIIAAQRLRYRVFYEEMSAIPTRKMRAQGRDFDRYDDFCDHLLVVDRAVPNLAGQASVVGTYRLLRSDVAALHGGYYTSSEYDLDPMLKANPAGTRYLELGRSCVLKSYRAKATIMPLLWRGVVLYVDRHGIDIMFGCGSFPGTDPEALKLPLSYLHHFHRAPPGQRVSARPPLYVEMNRLPMETIDPNEGLRRLPPLIKGYVRAGSYIGDGAVIDRQFGTTDVLIYFPVARIHPRWRIKFNRNGS